MIRRHLQILMFFILGSGLVANAQSNQGSWLSSKQETKPWTRWWWHGSAVTKDGITAEMEAYKKAGLGGLEITPIYGVHGTEKQFVNYLTADWMNLLIYTLKEAERLGLGIDMATGTGWPFGGPWVDDTDACKDLEYKIFHLEGGAKLKEKVAFIQQSYVRAIGNQIYEVHDSTIRGEVAKGTSKEPLRSDKREITIDQLVDPVANNNDLQSLALDQVKFAKALPLQTLMAFGANKTLNLADKVAKDGTLHWTAPPGDWKLYAVFSGSHGKMVERAGPGGEGNVIDHFSAKALDNYLGHFDAAFKDYDLSSLRAFFNDSYEVDDARGTADWTPLLFEEFQKRRGYDLKLYLPALFGQDQEEANKRVLCDYRETISELLLDNFTARWKKWAHQHNALVRNQAHGSPSNILDLYATVDIPEIEGVEPLRIKMASSAGNVTGKKLISAEAATWLNEHFESNLSDIKIAVDRFMVNGINHIVYHGTCYSPADEPWPGWLFYAAVHLNPRNSLWPHFSTLNNYIARSQFFLQTSAPDNDVLLYYPIYDRFSAPGDEMIEHFDGVGVQFDQSAFKRAAEKMLESGVGYDYISDKQIAKIRIEDTSLITEGGGRYKTIVIPVCDFIPLPTLKTILTFVQAGGRVIFFEGLPKDISGFANRDENKKAFQTLLRELGGAQSLKGINTLTIAKGQTLTGSDLPALLTSSGVHPEKFVREGIHFLRKKTTDAHTQYFLVNGDKAFSGWIECQAKGVSAILHEPMTGAAGIATTRITPTGTLEIFLQLQPRESIFITIDADKSSYDNFNFYTVTQNSTTLSGPWKVEFVNGGPALPADFNNQPLRWWTDLDDQSYKIFSGCARYTSTFKKPGQRTDTWLLDLGEVKESAEIFLNGNSLGVSLGPVFQIPIKDADIKSENKIEVEVCNLMANRISYMDQKGIFWKKFYNVNFPARKAENRKNGIFDASHWAPRNSGLNGPVTLHPASPKISDH